ncbi:LacI family transcriptional regulator, partial [Paraburkholderia aspalathi]|nr:LacI family transcriptional regulator [Paraburkholderia aspalathi]
MGQIKKSHQIKPRATIVDIAKELGLSQATVSNALNGRPYVKAKTQQKVEEAALRLGYKPNLRAQRLRTGSADTIALFSSMPFSIAAGPSRLGFFMEIAAVAASAALANGMALILVPPQEKAAAYPIEKLAIDGAIVIEPETGDDAIIRLQQLNL